METAAATCYASKLFRRTTQILELTKKRTEEQSLHDVLFELNRTVLRQRSISGYEMYSKSTACTEHVVNAVEPHMTKVQLYSMFTFHFWPNCQFQDCRLIYN